MKLRNDRELANTREKLRLLELSYEEVRAEIVSEEDRDLRDAELESIKRLINQFKEEIACYHAHAPARP